MTNIVILGGSGFVGNFLIDTLQGEGFSLKMMAHEKEVDTKIKQFKGDILVKESFENEIESGDIVVNLIGQMKEGIDDLIELSIQGGLNILKTCKKKKVKQIIFASTINVYGENNQYPSKESDPLKPKTDYSLIKYVTEKLYEIYAKNHGVDVNVLRFSNLYGSTKEYGIVSRLIKSITTNQTIKIYNNGAQLRDFLFIKDATGAILNVIKNPQTGFEVLNISSGNRYSIKEIIEKIGSITSKELNVEFSSEKRDETCVWADNSKAKRILDFTPQTNIDEGLRLTLKNFSHP